MGYDIFANLHEALARRCANEGAEKFGSKFVGYKTSRNLGEIIRVLIGSKALSPAIAWQAGEVAFPLFSKRAKNILDNNELGLSVDSKSGLRDIADSRPVWGISNKGDFPTLDEYTGDSNASRKAEASRLPPFCFRMQIYVPMKSPILIKGDRPFVSNENPFCTEKVTGWPLLRPSSLKGQLRHAALAALANNSDRVDILFGNANDEESIGSRGRLEFLPCYLHDSITPDLLAPHDETTRRIVSPVTLEVVRPTNDVNLCLQYWPLDSLNRYVTGEDDGTEDELFNDFECLIKALTIWFRDVGVGAKTNSGYGQVMTSDVEVELSCPGVGPWGIFWSSISDGPLGLEQLQASFTKEIWESAWLDFLTTPS